MGIVGIHARINKHINDLSAKSFFAHYVRFFRDMTYVTWRDLFRRIGDLMLAVWDRFLPRYDGSAPPRISGSVIDNARGLGDKRGMIQRVRTDDPPSNGEGSRSERGRGRSRRRPEHQPPPAHDWRTTDADEIARRRLRARDEDLKVIRPDGPHPVFAVFTVKSP